MHVSTILLTIQSIKFKLWYSNTNSVSDAGNLKESNMYGQIMGALL